MKTAVFYCHKDSDLYQVSCSRFICNRDVVKKFSDCSDMSVSEYQSILDSFPALYMEKHPRVFEALYDVLRFCLYYRIDSVKVYFRK